MNPERLTQSRPPDAAAMHDTGTPAWLSPATNTPRSARRSARTLRHEVVAEHPRDLERGAGASPVGVADLQTGAWPVGAVHV